MPVNIEWRKQVIILKAVKTEIISIALSRYIPDISESLSLQNILTQMGYLDQETISK